MTRPAQRAQAIKDFGGKCNYCGNDDRLQFDHVNPATKTYRVRELWDSRRKWAEEKDKLQLLCYTCHKLKTIAEQTKPLIHGTTNAYNRKKCRCDVCRQFMAARKRAYDKARRERA